MCDRPYGVYVNSELFLKRHLFGRTVYLHSRLCVGCFAHESSTCGLVVAA